MKKFFTKIIANVISFSLLSLLAYASYTGSSSLTNLTVAAYWVIMALGLFIGILLLVLSYAKDHAKSEDEKNKVIELIVAATKKKSIIFRFIDWFCLAAIVALLAYSGWVFTAVFYVMVALIVKLLISIARDNVSEQNKPESA